MKAARQSCGCTFLIGDIERWVELCPPHKTEADTIHADWATQHRASTPLPPKQASIVRNITKIGRQP